MAKGCADCGLCFVNGGGTRCYLTGRPVDIKKDQWHCHFHCEIIKEDGKPISPEQHYLIKKSEIERLK